jgi:hypothetical protein
MPPDGAVHTGGQLDENHPPETNGRMSVCRRCGSQTDGPAGTHHLPSDRQVGRVRDWLVAELTRMDIKRSLDARGG